MLITKNYIFQKDPIVPAKTLSVHLVTTLHSPECARTINTFSIHNEKYKRKKNMFNKYFRASERRKKRNLSKLKSSNKT